MSDEKVRRNEEKLRKLRSMMNRIHASSHSDTDASLSNHDLNNSQRENQLESTTPIVHSNDDRRKNEQVVPSNDNSETTNMIISVLFRSIEPVPFDPSVDSLPYSCFNCRKKGFHRYKECTIPKNHEFCLNCGRRGVTVQNCPRCYKAHREFEKTRRPVEQMPPQKSIERSSSFYERKREQSRARSRVRNNDESREYREKSRHREQNNYEWPESRDGGAGFSSGERKSREKRNPTRDNYESQGSRDGAGFFTERKSRERIRNPVRFDLNDYSQNSYGADYLNANERKNREERNADWDNNYGYEDNAFGNQKEEYNNNMTVDEKLSSDDDEPVKDFTSQFHELMAAIRHLPNETQTELIEHFVKERHRALINSGGV